MKKVLLILLSFLYVSKMALAEELNINKYKQVLTQCYNNFEQDEKRCSDWNSRCFNQLLAEQEKLQKCYQKVAVSIFTKFYDLSAPNLYSEYATSQGLYNYINKTINYIENQ